MKTLVLASASPRRRDLLQAAGFRFHTHPVKVSEMLEENLTREEAMERLALQKARSAAESPNYANQPNFLFLGADTLVFLDSEPLGKPENLDEAKVCLRRLSGRVHEVISAVALWDPDERRGVTSHEKTRVEFHPLSPEDIETYVIQFRPLDKAGAYGLQEVPKTWIRSLSGTEDNVIGLPVQRVRDLLKEHNWHVGV